MNENYFCTTCGLNVKDCKCPKKTSGSEVSLTALLGKTREVKLERLWIVEARFSCGTWGICDFGLGIFSATNYYVAHEMKRKQQAWLKEHGSKEWYKNRFRVREYKAVA